MSCPNSCSISSPVTSAEWLLSRALPSDILWIVFEVQRQIDLPEGLDKRVFARLCTVSDGFFIWRISRVVCGCNFLSILWQQSQLDLSFLLEVLPHVRAIFEFRACVLPKRAFHLPASSSLQNYPLEVQRQFDSFPYWALRRAASQLLVFGSETSCSGSRNIA